MELEEVQQIGFKRRFYKTTDLAKLLGVSRTTIQQWILKKKIKAIKLEEKGIYLIPEEEIKKFLEFNK